ncbi:MAG: ABC transporter permease [Spirochaetia bacterium]
MKGKTDTAKQPVLKTLLQYFLRFKALGVLVILVLLVIFVGIFSPQNNFVRPRNISNLLAYGSEFAVIVLGVGMLMIAGEFDLSVGSVLAFGAFIFSSLFRAGVAPFPAFLVTMVGGAVMGLINGLITVKGKILSFVATLGTMMMWRGLTLLFTGGQQRPCDVSEYRVFTWIFTGRIGGFFPMQAVWFLFFTLVLIFLLHKHSFGNWVYGTGDNPLAARAMCINTDMVKIVCFITVGLLVAFASTMQIIRVGSFSTRVGTGWELKIIAAAVVGGTSLLGGRGTMVGIFLGALIIMVIENALTVTRLPYEWTFMVYGLVILGSSLLDLYIEKQKLRYT